MIVRLHGVGFMRSLQITGVLVIVWPSLLLASSVGYPLQNRVKDADVIVVGTLSKVVPDRFSIVFHKYLGEQSELEPCGEVEHSFTYDAGELLVEKVLKGNLRRGVTYVAFCSAYETDSEERGCRGMSPDPELTFTSGDYGIWILRRNRFVLREFLGATYHDALVPMDSLKVVKKYITKDTYINK